MNHNLQFICLILDLLYSLLGIYLTYANFKLILKYGLKDYKYFLSPTIVSFLLFILGIGNLALIFINNSFNNICLIGTISLVLIYQLYKIFYIKIPKQLFNAMFQPDIEKIKLYKKIYCFVRFDYHGKIINDYVNIFLTTTEQLYAEALIKAEQFKNKYHCKAFLALNNNLKTNILFMTFKEIELINYLENEIKAKNIGSFDYLTLSRAYLEINNYKMAYHNLSIFVESQAKNNNINLLRVILIPQYSLIGNSATLEKIFSNKTILKENFNSYFIDYWLSRCYLRAGNISSSRQFYQNGLKIINKKNIHQFWRILYSRLDNEINNYKEDISTEAEEYISKLKEKLDSLKII